MGFAVTDGITDLLNGIKIDTGRSKTAVNALL